MVMAIFLSHIGDDLIAAVVLEIKVNIRHLFTLHIQEALENKPVFQRVYVGDTQAIKNQAGSSTPTHPTKNVALPGKGDNIPHYEKVMGKLRLPNNL